MRTRPETPTTASEIYLDAIGTAERAYRAGRLSARGLQLELGHLWHYGPRRSSLSTASAEESAGARLRVLDALKRCSELAPGWVEQPSWSAPLEQAPWDLTAAQVTITSNSGGHHSWQEDIYTLRRLDDVYRAEDGQRVDEGLVSSLMHSLCPLRPSGFTKLCEYGVCDHHHHIRVDILGMDGESLGIECGSLYSPITAWNVDYDSKLFVHFGTEFSFALGRVLASLGERWSNSVLNPDRASTPNAYRITVGEMLDKDKEGPKGEYINAEDDLIEHSLARVRLTRSTSIFFEEEPSYLEQEHFIRCLYEDPTLHPYLEDHLVIAIDLEAQLSVRNPHAETVVGTLSLLRPEHGTEHVIPIRLRDNRVAYLGATREQMDTVEDALRAVLPLDAHVSLPLQIVHERCSGTGIPHQDELLKAHSTDPRAHRATIRLHGDMGWSEVTYIEGVDGLQLTSLDYRPGSVSLIDLEPLLDFIGVRVADDDASPIESVCLRHIGTSLEVRLNDAAPTFDDARETLMARFPSEGLRTDWRGASMRIACRNRIGAGGRLEFWLGEQ